MGVLLNLPFLVKRLEYDGYFIEKSVHPLLKIQSLRHTIQSSSHLHISIPLLSLIKTKQTANVVLELETKLGVRLESGSINLIKTRPLFAGNIICK